MYDDFPVPVPPTSIRGFWCVMSNAIIAILRTVSAVGTIIWFTGMSLGMGGVDDSSSDHNFHFPLPYHIVKFITNAIKWNEQNTN